MPADTRASELNDEQLRQAAILISEFISDTILDPHCGFEGLFAGEARVAKSREELLGLLQRVLDSLNEFDFSAPALSRLDRQLLAADLPDLAGLQ